MEEKFQKEEGISLMDIVRLLFSKIKLLILVVILGGLLGGAFAVWRNIDVKIYGTEVQFYVNPEKPKDTTGSETSQYGVYGAYGRHVMDNMVKLLSSESFTEQLIIHKKPDGQTLEEWRETSEYRAELSKYTGRISYTYLEGEADEEEANNLARSFIYVKISVLNNEELANEIYQSIITVVPEYVEENMPVPSDYQGTNCQRISRMDEVRLKNPNQTVNQAIKYAILFAVASAVIACVVIIIIDRSDKRLRDEETIVRLFNVPVLGIVPTIDYLVEQTTAKKNELKKNKHKSVKQNHVSAATEAPRPAPQTANGNTPKKATETKAKQQNNGSNKPKNKKGNRR